MRAAFASVIKRNATSAPTTTTTTNEHLLLQFTSKTPVMMSSASTSSATKLVVMTDHNITNNSTSSNNSMRGHEFTTSTSTSNNKFDMDDDTQMLNDWYDSCQRNNDEHWDRVHREMGPPSDASSSPSPSPMGVMMLRRGPSTSTTTSDQTSQSSSQSSTTSSGVTSPFDFKHWEIMMKLIVWIDVHSFFFDTMKTTIKCSVFLQIPDLVSRRIFFFAAKFRLLSSTEVARQNWEQQANQTNL